MKKRPEVSLILHNLRSAYNVGAIFRTVACLPFGPEVALVSKIYLTGYTPLPLDKFGQSNKKIAKTALGAEKYVVWKSFKNMSDLLSGLKVKGHKLVALEQAANSIDYRRLKITGPTAIMVGNEVRGLSRSILARCDSVLEISLGRKESLNVAVATGVCLFSLLDDNKALR